MSHSYTRCRFVFGMHLFEFEQFDIQSTGQKSQCVNTIYGHQNPMFYSNSRTLLSASILNCFICAQDKLRTIFPAQKWCYLVETR